jgi:hypothetical protein
MQVKGRTANPSGSTGGLRTTGSGASCTINTRISGSGLQTDLSPSAGDFAFFDSELHLTGPSEFQETGEIAFGEAGHLLRFSTIGSGYLTSDFQPGTIAGTVTWRVDSGEGQFAGAQGYITSNFTIAPSGERCDVHCGVIFLLQ